MRNFYYIQSYNLQHPIIQEMLEKLGMFVFHDSFSDLKVRSKHFIGYHEATYHAHADFDKKLTKLFPDVKPDIETAVKTITVMNPAFGLPDDVSELIEEQFGEQQNRWDDDCCGTMFFCNVQEGEEEDEFPRNWLMKYEIYFEEDGLLTRKNGEFAFEMSSLPFQSFSSSVH